MAVQQNKNRLEARHARAHYALNTPGTAIEPTTGERPASSHQPTRLLRGRRCCRQRRTRKVPAGGALAHRFVSSFRASAGAIRLAVDCMGGDHGPPVTLLRARRFCESSAGRVDPGRRADALAEASGWARCTVLLRPKWSR